MMFSGEPKELIREEVLDVQVRMNNKIDKTVIANMSSESANSHSGNIHINARLELEERIRNDQKKDKFELQTLKMDIECSKKKNKVFNISLGVNRGVKRSTDSKLHFLLQVTDKKALMTIIDDYAECGMKIKSKVPQISVSEAVDLQKKRQDKRRKGSAEEVIEDHNDPDFKGEEDEDH